MILYPLYIDPGTGSMLFSILIGAAATLYFVFRTLLIRMKVLVFQKNPAKTDGETKTFVIYNEGRQYLNVFRPIVEEFENRKLALCYLSSIQNDPLFTENYQFVKAEYIGENNKAFAKLNMLNANIVLMTTPGLDVYQLKRSKMVKHYCHILHAPSDATMYRMFGIDYYDSILLTGDYQAKDIRALEAVRHLPAKILRTAGCTYLDEYQKKINTLQVKENHEFTVLVSPSWGPSAILSKYGAHLLDHLVETNYHIIIRPHPQSKKSESAMLETLTEKYKDKANIEWDYAADNIASLGQADIMISDFSGIIFDYAFLFNKPILYVPNSIDLRPYDADDIIDNENGANIEKLWQFSTLAKIGIELAENDFPNIKNIIDSAKDDKALQDARDEAKKDAWQFQGIAAKNVVDFLVDTNNSLFPEV